MSVEYTQISYKQDGALFDDVPFRIRDIFVWKIE